MKKLWSFVGIFLLVFGIFLYFYVGKHNYTIVYTVNNVEIEERYDKKLEAYHFILKYDDYEYSIFTEADYQNKRKLINEIEIISEDRTCLVPKSDKIDVYGICMKDGLLEAYDNQVLESSEIKNFLDYHIYDFNNKNYLLWNYHNFVWINQNKEEEISLFQKDYYNLNLLGVYNQFLVVPDYDKEYSFDKLYVIDSKKGKVKNINLRYPIYFDSYFLGSKKRNLYLYDKKQEQEYYINMKSGKIYKTGNKILVNGEWESVSTYKLKEEKVSFKDDLYYSYVVVDNILYSAICENEYLTKISDRRIDFLVKIDGMGVYFISKDTLYYYHPRDGMKKLMSYSEWEFNSFNRVYIFD